MKIRSSSWQLILFIILLPIIFSACIANPKDLNAAFNEIDLNEALKVFPNLKVEAYFYNVSKPNEGRSSTLNGLSLEYMLAKRASEYDNHF